MTRQHSDMGWIYGLIPTFPNALDDFPIWLQHEPWHGDGWHRYAHHCEAHGNLDAAIDAYSRAIDIAHRYHPIIHFDHAALHYHEAIILHALKRDDEAHSALTKAIFQDHQHSPALALQRDGWHNAPSFHAYHTPFAAYHDKWQQLTRNMALSLPMTAYHHTHDAWVHAYQEHDFEAMQEISATLSDAVLCASGWLYRSLTYAYEGAWEAAFSAIQHGLTCMAITHKHYHYGASLHYLERGRCWLAQQEAALAYMDAVRACDIDIHHREAKLFLFEAQKALKL
ncbi:MAG: tetratricopeptide repeat protein [Alphaproteobacteria bacterium]|nr:MAG: tetratricopeptide repeat protein [Alphaproteobacteria bacterium]TAF15004.1 MAG: tetratricopeptide repeat protein [Alphaproteobacteria bacterium]TAF42011.1 MAG: tetratricopeptide repeat protein [Alphaproteobacteria bacterium]TAF76619.1 MAG: tetratricopeptide repeat protein [Alphaproteobacteria bacterium]